jgi:hypothetical protein
MDRLCVQSSRHRSRDTGFDSRRYQIFWEIVGLERGPLSLVRITDELLEWKNSGSGSRKFEINGRGDPLHWPRDTLSSQKMALNSPTCSGRSVGMVCLRTKATEFSLVIKYGKTCFLPFIHFPLGLIDSRELKSIEGYFMGTEVKLMVCVRNGFRLSEFAFGWQAQGTSCEMKFRNKNLRKARTVFIG